MTIDKQEDGKALPKRKKPSSFVRSSVGRPLTRKAGIFKLRGIGESKEPGGFSWRKHDLGV